MLLPYDVWQMLQAPLVLTYVFIKKKKGKKKETPEVVRADHICLRVEEKNWKVYIPSAILM